MNKELANLLDLKSAFVSHCRELGCEDNYIKICSNKFDIIETALKKLENYEQNEDFSKDVLNYAFLNEQDKIKKLKVLEIIKKKKVDIKYLYYRAEFNVEKYNDNYIETLTQEECNLLKEVMYEN